MATSFASDLRDVIAHAQPTADYIRNAVTRLTTSAQREVEGRIATASQRIATQIANTGGRTSVGTGSTSITTGNATAVGNRGTSNVSTNVRISSPTKTNKRAKY
jgi:hypothetical protein